MILNTIVDFCKKRTALSIAAVLVVIAAFVVMSEWSHRGTPAPPQVTGEGMEYVESEGIPEEPEESPPPRSLEAKEPAQRTQVVESAGTRETGEEENQTRQREKLKGEIEDLQQKLKETQQRILQLQEEERRRAETRNQVLQMLESHSSHVENLGNTLRQVFKTPQQIRIIATELKNQAGGLRVQIQSESRVVGSSTIDQEIWTVKKAVMEQRAADLEALALDLQRTGGEPAKVRIIAIRIQEKAEKIRANIQSTKREKIEPNPELLTAEKQRETLQNRIQELQEQQRELASQGS